MSGSSTKKLNLTLHVWRQKGPNAQGQMVTYPAPDISPDMSFLEMLDVVNERLIEKGEEPIAFDHDCREGICGTCSCTINGKPQPPLQQTFRLGANLGVGMVAEFAGDPLDAADEAALLKNQWKGR